MATFGKYSTLGQSVFTGNIFAKYAMACVVKCTLDFDIHSKDESETDALIDAIHSLMEVFHILLMTNIEDWLLKLSQKFIVITVLLL